MNIIGTAAAIVLAYIVIQVLAVVVSVLVDES